MIKYPRQIDAVDSTLIRGWKTSVPKFYGLHSIPGLYDKLLETEQLLRQGVVQGIDPSLCRVMSSYHGPRGAKIPLTVSTITGCIRPYFVKKNETIKPSSPSCYDGHCYIFHARSVPGKKDNNPRVFAHRTQEANLIVAGKISKHFRVPIRDNQSSDGSFSMAVFDKRVKQELLLRNLDILSENGLIDVPYLCFSSAYAKVDDKTLSRLSIFPSLVVHVTVSGWHSQAENLLRLREFERYSKYIKNTWIRVVNRQDWAGIGKRKEDSGARCELWLIDEIDKRGLLPRVIRTPFHSISPFPGSKVGSLGSRHMAGTDYSQKWYEALQTGSKQCCLTGKCKTCLTRCGISYGEPPQLDYRIAANALVSMLYFEIGRQRKQGGCPLGYYVARLLSKKAAALFSEGGSSADSHEFNTLMAKYTQKINKLSLSSIDRRRLVNDSHGLIQDGLDRHKLWKNYNCSIR